MSVTGKVENITICSGASAFAREWCCRRGCGSVSRELTESGTIIEAQLAKPKRNGPRYDVGGFMGEGMVYLTYLAFQPLESLPLSNEIPCCEFFQEGPEREEGEGEVCQAQD